MRSFVEFDQEVHLVGPVFFRGEAEFIDSFFEETLFKQFGQFDVYGLFDRVCDVSLKSVVG